MCLKKISLLRKRMTDSDPDAFVIWRASAGPCRGKGGRPVQFPQAGWRRLMPSWTSSSISSGSSVSSGCEDGAGRVGHVAGKGPAGRFFIGKITAGPVCCCIEGVWRPF